MRCELEGSHGDRPAVIDGHGHCGGYTTMRDSTCSAEERSEITTVPDGLIASAPAFAGVSGDVVAIAPYAWIGGELPDTPALFGIDTSTGKSVWTESFPGKWVKIRADYSESGQQVPYVFDVGIADSSGLEDRSLRDVATGATVVEATDFESPSLIVGDGFVFTDASGDFPYSQTSLTDGTLSPVSGGFLSGEAVSAVDEAGLPVAVGPMCLESDTECPVTNPDRSLGYVGADHAVHEILSADQVESLQVSFLGASSGRLYFATASENLIADFNGELVGEPYDSVEYPFSPVAERVVDGESWTLWVTREGIFSIGQERYAISKNGEFPEAP